MESKFRIEGIYDQRTLKNLKEIGVKDFTFDFCPKSFNFIQEYVFLEKIISSLTESDRIFLKFNRSNDLMVEKLISDLQKNNYGMNNIIFEFNEWAPEMQPINFQYNYILHFSTDSDLHQKITNNFKGFIFNLDFFEYLFSNNLLSTFANNFYTKFGKLILDSHLLILKCDWNQNRINSVFDLFEFDLLSFPINSKIEVCYRNVDLNKLKYEMKLIAKSLENYQGF